MELWLHKTNTASVFGSTNLLLSLYTDDPQHIHFILCICQMLFESVALMPRHGQYNDRNIQYNTRIKLCKYQFDIRYFLLIPFASLLFFVINHSIIWLPCVYIVRYGKIEWIYLFIVNFATTFLYFLPWLCCVYIKTIHEIRKILDASLHFIQTSFSTPKFVPHFSRLLNRAVLMAIEPNESTKREQTIGNVSSHLCDEFISTVFPSFCIALTAHNKATLTKTHIDWGFNAITLNMFGSCNFNSLYRQVLSQSLWSMKRSEWERLPMTKIENELIFPQFGSHKRYNCIL